MEQQKILIVQAHPDDETIMAGAIFKFTQYLHGVVDLLLVTNGEGGYKHTQFAEKLYGVNLSNEENGREELPRIRKQELEAGGKILGIKKFIYLDEVDDFYSIDLINPMENWEIEAIKDKSLETRTETTYDFVFVWLPIAETHAHHQATSILLLQVVDTLPEAKRPIVLGCTEKREIYHNNTQYSKETRLMADAPLFMFDKNQKLININPRMDFNVVVCWIKACHPSQALLFTAQEMLGNTEYYYYFEINGAQGLEKTRKLFDRLNKEG
jgi:LmbE family N-acetylglucosaminyl deacetylase